MIEDRLYGTIYKYLVESQFEELKVEDIYCINTIEADTRELIDELGVRANLNGYKYLNEFISVELLKDTQYSVYNERNTVNMIATKNNTVKTNLERSIRYAIQDLSKSRDYNELNKIIGRDIFSKYGVPSNLEFIFCAAEKIRKSKIRKSPYRGDEIH